jgi:MFS family permease
VISGFLSPLGWKWAFWVTLIYAGVSCIPVLLLPETYAPVLLRRRAAKLRKETGDKNIVALAELEEKGLRHVITIVLTRPIRMFLFEAIVLFSCLYSAFTFGIFYLFFEAYPIIFQG